MRFFILLGLAVLAACGDSNSPNESVAGTYHATELVFTPTGEPPVDILAEGGSIDLVLTPQGTTTGTLVIPAVFTEDGLEDEVISLDGTYTRTGNTLRFQGGGDSFITDVVWAVGNGTLTATNTLPGATLEATLTRS
jgi:hypothetical protein